MTISTDGRQIVWVLFNADGYAYENFLGVFHSESEAETARDYIVPLIEQFYREHMGGLEWKGSVTVRPITLGTYRIPPDAGYMLKNADLAEPTNRVANKEEM